MAWEYPAGQGREAAPHPGGPPLLSLEGFEGPLDFLLEMVRQQKLRLGQLSIVPLAEQFVAALEASRGQVPLERQADWLVMASELVRLKAQALLPPVPEVAGEAPGEAGEEAARQLRRWEEQAAIRAAAAVGATMAGVDLLDDLDRGAPVVVEVNAVPGWRALAGATGRDIADEIVDTLRGLGR